MYDYIKLSTYSVPFAHKVRENSLLTVWDTYSRSRTGLKYELSEYRGLRFMLYPSGRIEISGSLHVYMNNGEHNFNDFSMNDVDAVINELSSSFGPEILTMAVQNLEFGLNIRPQFTASEFTDKVIVYLSRGARLKHAITKDDAKGFDKGIKFILQSYILKFYNKSAQYLQPGNILRCEYKTRKMKIVKEASIETLTDLLKPTVSAFLFDKLIASIANLVVNESIDNRELTQHQKIVVLECLNPEYWKSITKFKRTDRKKQFDLLTRQYGTTDIKAIVKQLLIEKYLILSDRNNESTYVLPDPAKKGQRLSRTTLKALTPTYYPLSIGVIGSI